MKRTLILILLLIFIIPTYANSESKIFVKEYTYQASEIDSKSSSRVIAIEQVKRLVLEEIGTYIISETRIKNYKLIKDEIITFTAGSIKMNIIDEKWDGHNYWLRASVTADPDDVARSVEEIIKIHQLGVILKANNERELIILNDINNLKNRSQTLKISKSNKEQYQKLINKLTAAESFQNGLNLQKSENYAQSIKMYDQAIKLNPNNIYYLQRASAFMGLSSNNWKDEKYDDCIANSKSALKV